MENIGHIVLIGIGIIWFGLGAVAAILNFIYESKKQGDAVLNIDTLCDMLLCVILGVFSFFAIRLWEKDNILVYK